jgi:hypothetical protein
MNNIGDKYHNGEKVNPTKYTEEEQNWYFTFGFGQRHNGKFVKIFGTCDSTRKKMFEQFGDKWSFQYPPKRWVVDGVSQEEKWKYKELKIEEEANNE